ncbi:hypothetical protein BGX34_003382 [Mortierella sp. NVP85]|nr:hypothetical protein BGX34_003382 [Mortierella sp. NVP85]
MFMHMKIEPKGQSQHHRDQEVERDHLFEAMVGFVQQHTSVHKHVLQQAVVPDLSFLPGTYRHSNEDIRLKIMSLLPPLHNPRSIDNRSWSELVARLPDTNLKYVQSITLVDFAGTISAEKTLALLDSQSPFLPRCRFLDYLEMETLGPDMFHWAVLEKRQLDAKLQQEGIVRRYLSSRPCGHHSDLVPLRSIKISHKTPLKPVQELNDIAFAFSDSLEELIIDDKQDARRAIVTNLSTIPGVVHGYGWTLPHLRVLHFHALYSQLNFDVDALQRFCALESLVLVDCIRTYDHRHIRSWPSVHLPQLKNLALAGSPALFFNLDSLHHSPCLEDLSLGMASLNNGFYIPPPEDFYEDHDSEHSLGTTGDYGLSKAPILTQGYQSSGMRPRFTWDWYLPKLRELDLNAVFAYKFNFQWLQHLPNLQSLQLNTSSLHYELRERGMTLKDLSRGQQPDGDRGQTEPDRYLSLPKLETINLRGQWTVSREALEVFCLIVAPNLRELMFGKGCRGCMFREWVNLSRRMVRLEHSRSDWWMVDSDVKVLGLLSPNRPQVQDRSKRRVKHEIRGATYWDVFDP